MGRVPLQTEFLEKLKELLDVDKDTTRSMTLGLPHALTYCKGTVIEVMQRRGWKPTVWESDITTRRQRESISRITESLQNHWLKAGPGQEMLRATIFPPEFPLSNLRQSHLDASAFFASTGWDAGSSQDQADITDNCILTYSSQLGEKARMHLPQFIDNCLTAVDNHLCNSITTGKGINKTIMLPFGE